MTNTEMFYTNEVKKVANVITEISQETIKFGLPDNRVTTEDKEKFVVSWIKGFPFSEIVFSYDNRKNYVLVGNELLMAIYSFINNDFSLSEESVKEVKDFYKGSADGFKGQYCTLPEDIRKSIEEADMLITIFQNLTNKELIEYSKTRSNY